MCAGNAFTMRGHLYVDKLDGKVRPMILQRPLREPAVEAARKRVLKESRAKRQ
jgi:hypothetical protein